MIEFTLMLTIITSIPDHEPRTTLREIDGYKSKDACEAGADNLKLMHAQKGLRIIIKHMCVEKREI